MCDVAGALPLAARRELRASLLETIDPFVLAVPKVELHVHIEGIITPELKWKFASRNGIRLMHPRTGKPFSTLEEYHDSHDPMKNRDGKLMDNSEETMSFFDAYYGGFAVLKTEQDYFDLAMYYFEHAAAMNVRYCEIFFDPQGHTRFGVEWKTMMSGFDQAQRKAESDLHVKSAWIMCFLRDAEPQSAMEHYTAALDYRHMIAGIGLDSNEKDRPPMLFDEVFTRARADGFRITSHCDVGESYPQEHIYQVLLQIGESGADRIDHGLNAVSNPDLVKLIRDRNIGMTVCPWSYIVHQPFEEVFRRIRVLFNAGIKISIGSDDPAFMEDAWLLENLLLVKKFCKFTDSEILKLTEDAVQMCWAPENVKAEIMKELRGMALTQKA